MKKRFQNQYCSFCGTSYDGLAHVCPKCKRESSDPSLKAFAHFVPVSPIRQALLFLLGWAGFQGLGLIISSIYLFAAASSYPGITPEELKVIGSSTEALATVTFASYGVLTLILGLVFYKDSKVGFKSFASLRTPILGLAGFGALFLFSFVYSSLIGFVFPNLPVNANQEALEKMIHTFPVASIFVIGILGPWCEELAYRVGLFSFFARFGKLWGYLISALVFGLIHFDFQSFGNGQDLLVEVLNLPSYLAAGFLLAGTYDLGGLGASFTAHSLNNLVSVISIALEYKNA